MIASIVVRGVGREGDFQSGAVAASAHRRRGTSTARSSFANRQGLNSSQRWSGLGASRCLHLVGGRGTTM